MKNSTLKISFLFIVFLYSNSYGMIDNEQYVPEYSFTENKGQLMNSENLPASEVLYYSNMGSVDIYICSDKLFYVFKKISNSDLANDEKNDMSNDNVKTETFRVELKLINSNLNIKSSAEDACAMVSNYFLPNCPNGITARNFKKIKLESVYPGIDWILYFKKIDGQVIFKYDFEIKPGADYSQIQFQYNGANSISKTRNGGIEIETLFGNIQDGKPFTFLAESKEKINSSFILKNNQIGFDVKEYDKNKKLVIDPTVIWSTYFGYNTDEHGRAITVDSAGFIYSVGFTNSSNFPVLNGYSSPVHNAFDGWIVKLSPQFQPIWITYIGGSLADVCRAVDVDSAGNVFVGMETRSADMPTFNPYQAAKSDTDDFFILKLTPSGFPIWASFYGGNNLDALRRIKLSNQGYLVASGYSRSTNFPMINPLQANNAGDADAVIMKVNMNTGFPIWSTYYGGTEYDEPVGITVDNNDNIFVVGTTKSANFPVLNPYQNVLKGLSDIFVIKISSLNTVSWSTYIGSTGDDDGNGIAVDNNGNCFIIGSTGKSNYPHVNSWQPTIKLPSDAVITKFTSAGALAWSTFAGGVGTEDGQAIAVDNSGNVLATGYTLSSSYPILNATQPTFGGNRDAFIIRFTNNGTCLMSTYYGGTEREQARGIAVDNKGCAYVIGSTSSFDLPLVNPIQSTNGSIGSVVGDCFMMKINYSVMLQPIITLIGQNPKCNNNDTIELVSSSASGNSWSDGSTNQSLLTTSIGIFSVTAIDTTGIGVTSEPVIILNNPIASVVFDSIALNYLCLGSSVNLTASNIAGAVYNWTGPNGFSSSSNNPVINNLQQNGLGIYSCQVTSGACSKIIKKINLVNLINNLSPTNTAYSGAICHGGQFSLQTDSIPGGQFLWNGPNGFSATSRSVTITNAQAINAGNYSVKWILNGCESLSSTVSVVIYSIPVADAGQDLIACNGNNSINLDGTNVSVGIGTFTCTTLPIAVIQNQNDAKSLVTNLKVGTNQFKWNVINGSCSPVFDLVNVKYTTAVNFGCIKPSNLKTVINGNSATLSWSTCSVANQFQVRITLNGVNYNLNTTNYSTVLNNLAPGTYTWKVRPNCSGSWSVYSVIKTFVIVGPKFESTDSLENNFLNLFPNPVTDLLNISFEIKTAGEYKLEMIDLLGRVLIYETNEYEEGNWSENLFTGELNSGVFFIRLTGPGNFRLINKFVKP